MCWLLIISCYWVSHTCSLTSLHHLCLGMNGQQFGLVTTYQVGKLKIWKTHYDGKNLWAGYNDFKMDNQTHSLSRVIGWKGGDVKVRMGWKFLSRDCNLKVAPLSPIVWLNESHPALWQVCDKQRSVLEYISASLPLDVFRFIVWNTIFTANPCLWS